MAVHRYKTPKCWTALYSSCPRNVRLLDERTFLVDRNMMFTRDDLMPVYCSYNTKQYIQVWSNPWISLVTPFSSRLVYPWKLSLRHTHVVTCYVMNDILLRAESKVNACVRYRRKVKFMIVQVVFLSGKCHSQKHFSSNRNLRIFTQAVSKLFLKSRWTTCWTFSL